MRLPFFHAHIRETGAKRESDFHHDEGISGEKTIPGLNGVARRLRKSPTRSRILQRWNKGRENTSSVRFTRRMARVARRFKLLIHVFSRLNNGGQVMRANVYHGLPNSLKTNDDFNGSRWLSQGLELSIGKT